MSIIDTDTDYLGYSVHDDHFVVERTFPKKKKIAISHPGYSGENYRPQLFVSDYQICNFIVFF